MSAIRRTIEGSTLIDGAMVTTPWRTKGIARGKIFAASKVSTGRLAGGGELDVVIVPPADLSIALSFATQAEDVFELKCYEGTTITPAGQTFPVRNINRTFPDDAQTVIYEEPTIDPGNEGTLLFNALSASGSTIGGGSFWVLKPGVNYLLRYINQGSNNAYFSFYAELAEVDINDLIEDN